MPPSEGIPPLTFSFSLEYILGCLESVARALALYGRIPMMSTGLIFQEVTGKFDLWRSRRWRSGFKSDTIQTLQPLHHCSVGYQPSTT
jgi:hypothetical protein